MSIIDDIQSGDAEITDATIEPTEMLVAQAREAVQRMRAKDAGDEQVFASIRVTQADPPRGRDVWAAWKAGDATIYVDIEIDGRTYLLFSPTHS